MSFKKYINNILLFSLISLIASCASKDIFYIGNGSGSLEEVGIRGYTEYRTALNGYTYFPQFQTTSSDAIRKSTGEKNYVDKLQELIKQGKDIDENEKKLKVMSDNLIASCKERVLNRVNFLRAFYTDLPKLSEKDFLKKYGKHLSRGMLKALKKSSKSNNKNNEYDLTMFYNIEGYNPASLKYIYTYKDPFKHGKPEVKYELFPFFNKENKWIHIDMGNDTILVKVEGEDKRIAIVGLANKYQNIKINTEYDR